MHRYDKFEKLYYKHILFKYAVIISIIILFLSGFFILDKIQKIKKNVKHNNTEQKEIKKRKSEKKIVKKIENIKNKSKEENKSLKSFHFILPNLSKILLTKKEFQQNKNSKKSISKKNIPKKENNHKKNKIKEIQINHNVNIDTIKIVEKTPDLKTLIQKFNTMKNFDLAILISKIYFKKKDLTNAQIWALKANNINPSSYKSWILFANILLKEKKTKKAKKILNAYINSYGQNDIIEEKLRSLNDK